MAAERIEAVKKVSEAFNNPQTSNTNLDAQGKSQFQNYVDSNKPIQNFQPLNKTLIDQTPVQLENTQHAAQNPIFAEENTSAQKAEVEQIKTKIKKRQQAEEIETVEATSGAKKTQPTNSLIQEMQNLNSQVSKVKRLSPEDLRQQAQGMIARIEEVKTQLSQAPADIKPSYQTVLRNRLTHIDDNLKIALSKAGVEYTPPVAPTGSSSGNPIQRFIGLLSSSQYQLEHLNQTIEQLSLKNVELTPANMLALQMKMGYVQQQMELFTSLLNKALESTKTIMNVQV